MATGSKLKLSSWKPCLTGTAQGAAEHTLKALAGYGWCHLWQTTALFFFPSHRVCRIVSPSGQGGSFQAGGSVNCSGGGERVSSKEGSPFQETSYSGNLRSLRGERGQQRESLYFPLFYSPITSFRWPKLKLKICILLSLQIPLFTVALADTQQKSLYCDIFSHTSL